MYRGGRVWLVLNYAGAILVAAGVVLALGGIIFTVSPAQGSLINGDLLIDSEDIERVNR